MIVNTTVKIHVDRLSLYFLSRQDQRALEENVDHARRLEQQHMWQDDKDSNPAEESDYMEIVPNENTKLRTVAVCQNCMKSFNLFFFLNFLTEMNFFLSCTLN